MLAAAILPLSTAYSVCEFTGSEAALDDKVADASLFYLTYLIVTGVAALIVLLPGAPLIPFSSSPRCSTPCCCCPCWTSCTGSPATVTSWTPTPPPQPAPRSTWRSSPSSPRASQRYSSSASPKRTPGTRPPPRTPSLQPGHSCFSVGESLSPPLCKSRDPRPHLLSCVLRPAEPPERSDSGRLERALAEEHAPSIKTHLSGYPRPRELSL